MRKLAFVLLVLFNLSVLAVANPITINFDNLNAGDVLSTQYSRMGVTFSGGSILAAGINLNEFDFPPHSGMNVVGDTSGPITVSFSHAVIFVSAFFTYSSPLTITAFGKNGAVLGSVNSLFAQNFTSSGTGSPNELINFSSRAGIYRITISGSPGGSSFAMDDLRFMPVVPEPGSFVLVMTGVLGIARYWRRGGIR